MTADLTTEFETPYRPRAGMFAFFMAMFGVAAAVAVNIALTEDGPVVLRGAKADLSVVGWGLAAFFVFFFVACAFVLIGSRSSRLRLTNGVLSVDSVFHRRHKTIRVRDIVGVREESVGRKRLLYVRQMYGAEFLILERLFPDAEHYRRFVELLQSAIKPVT